ncbi:Prolyl endopeptidase [Ananas comosus]|uniref:Prolyl endopeptidase n=1 Tax=Ananas comosus TaxID=4615 RepID=A0A199UPL4_ANACO|nr:Prolyl endopeptidase [Ananas comosus]
MAELWDPAIKLFGRTIAAVPPPPMPTPAAAAASDQVEPPEESPEAFTGTQEQQLHSTIVVLRMMMFHTRVLLGGIEVYDRYHDWRLDVDNMSYENELEGKAEVLLDSNTLSKDGTGALTMLAVRQDGKYLAYGLTENGSNWVTIKVMSIEDKQCQPDTLSWKDTTGRVPRLVEMFELTQKKNGSFISDDAKKLMDPESSGTCYTSASSNSFSDI